MSDDASKAANASDDSDPASWLRSLAKLRAHLRERYSTRIPYTSMLEAQMDLGTHTKAPLLTPFLCQIYETVVYNANFPVGARTGSRLTTKVADALARNPGSYIQSEKLPDGFLWLAADEGAVAFYLDITTGHVYTTDIGAPLPPTEQTVDDRQGVEEHRNGWLTTITLAADSLEELFEQWLSSPSGAYLQAKGELPPEMLDTDNPLG
ncbi:MAG TPA: hypothetical protein VMV29_24855 [Ktedonobacterales bacterium]|nr:hypothetical protein [Ktedonobacterales bacterium]